MKVTARKEVALDDVCGRGEAYKSEVRLLRLL